MAKGSGGTRNYSNNPHALENRKTEFDSIMNTGVYRDGYFDKRGGYFVIHKDRLYYHRTDHTHRPNHHHPRHKSLVWNKKAF